MISPDNPTDAVARIKKADRILCDVDGCLISGDQALPGAAAFLDVYANRLALVSNNSTDTAPALAKRFAALGLTIKPDQIYLAGEQAIAATVDRFGPARVLMLANPTMTDAAEDAGLIIDRENPSVVMVLRDTTLTFERLQSAVTWMARGCPVIVANGDLTHPGPDGPAIETGAIVELLKACVPGTGNLTVVGKPHRGLLDSALGDIAPQNAVMIGDNPLTDIAGADAIGMPSVQIGHQSGSVAKTFADLFTHR